MSELFYENLIHHHIDEELLKYQSERITIDVIEYLHKRQWKDFLRTCLNHVHRDLPLINKYLSYQSDFMEYKDILIERLQFFQTYSLNRLSVERIHSANRRFFLDHLDQIHHHSLHVNDIHYFALLANEIDLTKYPMIPHENVQKIVQYHLEHKHWDVLNNMIMSYTRFSYVRLFSRYVTRKDPELIRWVIPHISFEIVQEEDIYEMLDAVVLSQHMDIVQWFFDHFFSFLPYISVFQLILSTDRIDLLSIFIPFDAERFCNYLSNLNAETLSISYETFKYLQTYYSIPLHSALVWKMLLHHTTDGISKIRQFDSDYPNFNWNELPSFVEHNNMYVLSVDLLDFLRQKKVSYLQNMIPSIFSHAVSQRDEVIMKWCLTHYLSDIHLIELVHKSQLAIQCLENLQLLESYFHPIPMVVYDFVIKLNVSCGEENLLHYIRTKFPYRYQLSIERYVYDLLYMQYYKIYRVQIDWIRETRSMTVASEDCIICLESYSTIYQTNCQHHYCHACFEQWFTKQTQYHCAYCRQLISEVNEYVHEHGQTPS